MSLLARTELPSREYIAAHSTTKIEPAKKVYHKDYNQAYYQARRDRFYAKGLNAAGKVRGAKRRHWPELKGLSREEYKVRRNEILRMERKAKRDSTQKIKGISFKKRAN
jgi:hypothetical protein